MALTEVQAIERLFAIAEAAMDYVVAINEADKLQDARSAAALAFGILNARLRITWPENYNEDGSLKDLHFEIGQH
jgi:hypothetical protein